MPAGSIAHAHAPQSDRTAHSACAALIVLCPTDADGPRVRLSTCAGTCLFCLVRDHPRWGRAEATLARTSLLAVRARLDGLVIGMPHTRYR